MNVSDDLHTSPFARALRAQAAARKRMLARHRTALRTKAPPAAATDLPGRSLKQLVGSQYEQRALVYLIEAGLRPLACNPACRMGEIDLVMRDGTVLVLVEVRARANAGANANARFGSAGASITPAKQRRLIRATSLLMPGLLRLMNQDHRSTQEPACGVPAVRFDVVTFDGQAIQWLRHAFALD